LVSTFSSTSGSDGHSDSVSAARHPSHYSCMLLLTEYDCLRCFMNGIGPACTEGLCPIRSFSTIRDQ
jgi:hypothetical protein